MITGCVIEMKNSAQPRSDGRTKEEAAKAYRELEKRFLEENRLADERIDKPTSKPQSDFHKTTCRHCGVNVEYPSEGEGRSIPCPKCGKGIVLLVCGKDGSRKEGMRCATGSQPIYNIELAEERRKQAEREREEIAIQVQAQQQADSMMRRSYGDGGAKAPPKTTDGGVAGWIAAVVMILVVWGLCRLAIPSTTKHIEQTVYGVAKGEIYRDAIDGCLRRNANDPASIAIVSLGIPKEIGNGQRRVFCTARGKNSFGALVLQSYVFIINQDDNVTDWHIEE